MKSLSRKLSELKKQVDKDRQVGARTNYSPSIKSQVRELRESGVSASAISSVTGISLRTIESWSKSSKESIGFRSLPVSSEASSFELIFPNGIKVRGLSIEQLLEVSGYATAV